ncbi:Eukaryotic aspartyl protease [Aphelenchoides fujianensis]|nr:Eukaryotic aspartyl protease [Aphelenchoides fujianensis]
MKNTGDFADISVGTPPQLHRVLLDTGSPYFWIPKSGCKNAGGSTGRCKAGGRVYEPEASRTAVQLKKIFFHEYGRGTASGIYFEDKFACGEVAECAGGGRITFGSLDRENCGSSIAGADVEANGFLWKFKMDGLSVGKYALHYRSSAIVDTGSSAVHLPLAVIRSIVREVGAEESGALFLLPCTTRFVLQLQIGGHKLEVQSKELMRRVSRSKCQLLVTPRNEQPWILGAPFLRSYCVVHRWTERRLEFAPVLQ